MSLREIRRTVNALKRKLALPLAVINARRAAEAACDQWHTAQRNEKPLPAALDLVAEFRNHRCRFGEFHALHSYIRRHLESGELPQPDDMVRALLPRANKLGLVYQCFRYDLPARG